MDYIEEMIGKQAPIKTVLRMLCLYSISNGGLKTRVYDFFRKEIIQVCILSCFYLKKIILNFKKYRHTDRHTYRPSKTYRNLDCLTASTPNLQIPQPPH